jgi:glycosyltransferase involved in cell wall biosynthesis
MRNRGLKWREDRSISAEQHIAILISGLSAGGAERVIAILARHWAEQGRRLSIISFDKVDDPVYHALPPEVTLHRLGGKVGVGYRGNLKRLFRLRQKLDELQPDILISFLTKNNLLASLACVGRSTILVCSERNNPERQKLSPVWNVALKLGYRRADRIVCQTEAVKRCFPQAVQDRLVLIYNPIIGFERSMDADDRKMLCAVGRLTPQKGFDLLINAFAMIAARHPDWNLTIWGNGEIRARLERQVSDLGLVDRIALPGNSVAPGAWARDATIFVQASLYEGFGNALAEALASGLPVVATNCDFGPAEMITNGRDGLLVENENVPELAEAMSRMISDKKLRKRCGTSAKRSAQRFHTVNILGQWDHLIETITRHQGGANVRDRSSDGLAVQNEPA